MYVVMDGGVFISNVCHNLIREDRLLPLRPEGNVYERVVRDVKGPPERHDGLRRIDCSTAKRFQTDLWLHAH
jgi:hypothetical protein